MHARYADGITIRPLSNGDTATVASVFARLGGRSRERRFGGAKPRLPDTELQALARVDGAHHVLVAYVEGDDAPAGIARLVRDNPGLPEDELFESIPLYETRDYVRRVLLYAESYRELYP